MRRALLALVLATAPLTAQADLDTYLTWYPVVSFGLGVRF